MRLCRCTPAVAALLATVAVAQADADLAAREAKLHAAASKALLSFARSAETAKWPSRARDAYALAVRAYACDDPKAKAAAAGSAGSVSEAPPASARASVERGWATLARRYAVEHRELAEAMLAAGDAVGAARHFELCLVYEPGDVIAHRALGHEEVAGFYGTAEQIAFLRRRLAIDERARALVADDRGGVVLPASEIPPELAKAGLTVVGAKAGPWKVWTTSPSAEIALDGARWLARAQELLDFLLPSGPARREAWVEARPVHWVLLLRSEAEWAQFFAKNPDIQTRHKLDKPPGGTSFRALTGSGTAQIYRGPVEGENDRLVAEVTMWGFAGRYNEALGQGLVHTMTSLLCGTTLTWYGGSPKTSASPKEQLPREPREWSARLRDEILAGKDWPLVQVPRERLSSFRENVRVKTWSFVGWLAARYPVEWPRLFVALTNERNLLPEDVDRAFRDAVGRTAQEVESEWREFARGDSALAKAAASAK